MEAARVLHISINVCAKSNKVHCGTAYGVSNMIYLGINLHAAQITFASEVVCLQQELLPLGLGQRGVNIRRQDLYTVR